MISLFQKNLFSKGGLCHKADVATCKSAPDEVHSGVYGAGRLCSRSVLLERLARVARVNREHEHDSYTCSNNRLAMWRYTRSTTLLAKY